MAALAHWMRGGSASLALAWVVACGLNPQPEPPLEGNVAGGGHQAGASGEFASGGSAGSPHTGAGGAPDGGAPHTERDSGTAGNTHTATGGAAGAAGTAGVGGAAGAGGAGGAGGGAGTGAAGASGAAGSGGAMLDAGPEAGEAAACAVGG